ncbi:MAG: DMT family transporter [Actinomycetota bacterium]|nr:DMT family transporter [Actinomycetota bacterium]
MSKVFKAYLAITVLAVSWGTIPLIIKTSEITSISLVGIRTFIGSIFLSLFVIKKGLPVKDLLKPGLILGPLLAIHWVTMFESIELNSVTVGIGSVFSYPIFVLIIEKIKGKTLSTNQVLIIIFGFIGLIILLDINYIDSILGVFYGILSAISLSLIITIGEKYSTKLGGLKVAFTQLLVAGVCLFYFTIEGYQWMISNIIVSLFLGVFLTAIGLSTYWYAVKIIKPLSVSTITYLEPTTGVILGFLVLNENLRINQLVGFFIILAVGILQIINDSKPKSQES